MKFVVIIPSYNEIENIGNAINTLQKTFKKIKPKSNMIILVTDANSPDGTANEVKKLQKKYDNLYLIVEKEKRGLGAGYKDAMSYSFDKIGADVVITFDADLSHDPEVIPIMVDKVENYGAKYVCGTRYRKGGGIPPEWGFHRKLLSFSGNLLVRVLYFGTGMSDFTSGYKCFTREVYGKIKDDIGIHSGYTFAISTNLEPIRKGYKVYEVPYHFKDRTAGSSKMGPEYIFHALKFVLVSRVKDFSNARFGKVIVAGAVGSIGQFLSYGLIFKPLVEDKNIFNLSHDVYFFGFHFDFPALLALAFSIEVGIFTSYYVNNKWAFKDHRLSGLLFWRRFAKTNIVAFGAICIQLITFFLLSNLFGRSFLLDYIYQIIGILLGLIWNFYFYKKIIWKVNKVT